MKFILIVLVIRFIVEAIAGTRNKKTDNTGELNKQFVIHPAEFSLR